MKIGVVILVLAGVLALWIATRPKSREKYPTVDSKELKGVVRTTHDSPAPSKSQLDRRNRSNLAVKNFGLPCLEHLPVVEDESSLTPRSSKEIAERCLAVAICAVKGESNDQDLTKDLIKRFGASGFFSPNEKRFIDNQSPSKQELIDHAWQYERVHVLLWALGYVDAIKPINEICDVSQEVKILRSKTLATLIADSKPRSVSEILDQSDLYYRVHWAAIELRLNSKKSDKVNEGIVRERHYVLNWLIHYMQQEWDDITTDT